MQYKTSGIAIYAQAELILRHPDNYRIAANSTKVFPVKGNQIEKTLIVAPSSVNCDNTHS